jgi:hypothetical protein
MLAAAAQTKKPKVRARGLGRMAYAFPDLWHTLGPKQCHIVVNGQEILGEAARDTSIYIYILYIYLFI